MQYIGDIFAIYAPLQAAGLEGGGGESRESPKGALENAVAEGNSGGV